MSALGAWVLSILGAVLIGAVIDLVLPNGKMNKFLKSVFAAVTVLIVLLPLPNLVKNGFKSEHFLWKEDVRLQQEYLDFAASVKKNALCKGLRAALQNDGITLGEMDMEGDFSQNAPAISKVRINMRQVVITGQSEHIHNYTTVRTSVMRYLSVDEDVVELYER